MRGKTSWPELRRRATGHQQVNGVWHATPSKMAGQFEADKATHAETEECEIGSNIRNQYLTQSLDNWPESSNWRLVDSGFPPGKLYATHLDLLRKGFGPRSKKGGAAPRMSEAE